MSVNTSLLSDSYSSVNTSLCKRQNEYDVNFKTNETNPSVFKEWLVWQGGIAFYAICWLIILFLSFAVINFFRWQFRWRCLTERFVGQTEHYQKIKCTSWISIDEQAVGKDGATYLWFQVRQIVVYTWLMIFSVVLIVIHNFGEKQGPVKNVNSTTLSNIGVNGIHPVFCMAVLIILGRMMNLHGRERKIRSLATPNIPNRLCNRRWIMISGLPLTTTVDSLLNYLKDRFDSKRIYHDGISLLYDLTKLWPVQKQLKSLREIKRTLVTSGPEMIQNRLLDLLYSDRIAEAVESGRVPRPRSSKDDDIDALKFYSEMEAILSAKKNDILANLEFTGIAFVRFDTPTEAKATKNALRLLQQSARFWNDVVEDKEFRPSGWTVQYAPPGSQINWPQLKRPRPLWKKLAIWMGLAVTYLCYIVLLAAPGYVVELFQLVGEGSDKFTLSWKVFILPTIASFFTHKLTDWVTNIDRYRHHLSLSSIDLGRLRSICNLSAVLYLIRMMATKPLGYLFFGGFTVGDFNWACLFFPEHGSFITCAIIVNTSSGILMNHTRLGFMLSYLFKWFTFRSNAEQMTWRRNWRLEFDFAANYAELTSNFGLTMLIFIMFPVIGVVSWVCSICRFFSDRIAMMNIYVVSHTSPDLHREPIDKAICLSIFSPLALLAYRIIQLGTRTVEHFVEATFLAPLCVAILYALHLTEAHLRFHWPKIIRFYQWFGYTEDNEEEEEDVVDSSNNSQYEYDPVNRIQAEDQLYKTMI